MIEDKKISFSLLSAIHSGEEYLKKYLSEEGIEGDALDFGRMLHHYFLQKDTFFETYYVLPDDLVKPSSKQQEDFANAVIEKLDGKYNTSIAEIYGSIYASKGISDTKKEELAKVAYMKLKGYIDLISRNRNKEQVSSFDWYRIMQYESYVKNHKGLKLILDNSSSETVQHFNETEILFDLYGVEAKAFIDKLIIDHINKKIIIVELKTHSTKFESSNLKESFTNAILDYYYHVQIALYKQAVLSFIQANLPQSVLLYEIEYYFVVCRKNFFFTTSLLAFKDKYLINKGEDILASWVSVYKQMKEKRAFNIEYETNRLGEEVI